MRVPGRPICNRNPKCVHPCPSMSTLPPPPWQIAYVGTNQMSKTSARAKKEAKLIPDLVFYIDKFEAAVVTLGSKSKVCPVHARSACTRAHTCIRARGTCKRPRCTLRKRTQHADAHVYQQC